MLPLLLLLTLPYLFTRAASVVAGDSFLGAGFRRRGPPHRAGHSLGAASDMAMTAALGPAALLATPKGQAAVKRGLVLARGAKKGNPKARRRVAQTKAKAARGDPKAKKELAVIQTAAAIDARQEEEAYEDEGDEYGEFDEGDEE